MSLPRFALSMNNLTTVHRQIKTLNVLNLVLRSSTTSNASTPTSTSTTTSTATTTATATTITTAKKVSVRGIVFRGALFGPGFLLKLLPYFKSFKLFNSTGFLGFQNLSKPDPILAFAPLLILEFRQFNIIRRIHHNLHSHHSHHRHTHHKRHHQL